MFRLSGHTSENNVGFRNTTFTFKLTIAQKPFKNLKPILVI